MPTALLRAQCASRALCKGKTMSNRFNRASLLATTVIAGLAYASPAWAQETPPPAEETSTDDQAPGVTTQEAAVQEAASEGEDIVVTGTLIRNPNLE